MRQNTRLKFNQMCDKLAASYGVPSMNVQFAVEPTLQQRLQDKIVEQSTFLPKINIVPVDELAGENVLGSASGPVSGRSDTTKDSVERVPATCWGLSHTSTSSGRRTPMCSCATRRWTHGPSSPIWLNATPGMCRRGLQTTGSLSAGTARAL